MTNGQDYIRIFIATFFDAEALNLIAPVLSLDEESSASIRKVKPDKVHLTWKFIGDYPVSTINDLINGIDDAARLIQQTSLNMSNIEVWPRKRNPRQIVITSTEENHEVNNIFSILDNKLLEFGVVKESRHFNPHITIARFKKFARCNKLLLNSLENFIPQKLSINNINIVQSSLSCNGAEYKVLHNIKLYDFKD